MSPHREPESRRKWWVFVGIVLLMHALVLLFVRPEYFGFLLPDLSRRAGTLSLSGGSPVPDAIIAIQVDVEQPDDVEVPQEMPVAREPSAERAVTADRSGSAGPMESLDLGELVGEAPSPRPGGGAPHADMMPPRPVEITWPETRRLKHCIGMHLDVRILVDGGGNILSVEPQANDLPDDCLQAALDAAGKIKFTPGRVGGKAATLWAQVRIDFEEKR